MIAMKVKRGNSKINSNNETHTAVLIHQNAFLLKNDITLQDSPGRHLRLFRDLGKVFSGIVPHRPDDPPVRF